MSKAIEKRLLKMQDEFDDYCLSIRQELRVEQEKLVRELWQLFIYGTISYDEWAYNGHRINDIFEPYPGEGTYTSISVAFEVGQCVLGTLALLIATSQGRKEEWIYI